MADEMVLQTLGRIAASANGPSWVVSHDVVTAALAKVTDVEARTVLTDLVGMVGTLERRIQNMYLGTNPFLAYLDDAFRAMLEEQKKALGTPADPHDKAIAAIRLARVLTTKVQEHSAAHLALEPSIVDDVRTAMVELGNG